MTDRDAAMSEFTAHVLGEDGVVPVRFRVQAGRSGRELVNAEPLTMHVDDVLDLGSFGVMRLESRPIGPDHVQINPIIERLDP